MQNVIKVDFEERRLMNIADRLRNQMVLAVSAPGSDAEEVFKLVRQVMLAEDAYREHVAKKARAAQ